MPVEAIGRTLARFGFFLHGGFRPEARDGVPALPDGSPAAAVLLVGNAGPAMWQRFSGERPAGPAPLDSWTRMVLTGMAAEFGAAAVFPFQRPFLPFQRWAMRAGPCHPSPIGLLIHPEYGLWHAWRGALLFSRDIALPAPERLASPCLSCADRPCLTTCPVTAFSPTGYDAAGCLAHLDNPAGADCRDLGCRARRACPVGSGWRFSHAQARFHMAGFRQVVDGS